MKKILLLSAYLIYGICFSQTTNHKHKVKLTGVAEGTEIDSLLVKESNSEMRYIKYSDFLIKLQNSGIGSGSGGGTYTFTSPLSETGGAVSLDETNFAKTNVQETFDDGIIIEAINNNGLNIANSGTPIITINEFDTHLNKTAGQVNLGGNSSILNKAYGDFYYAFEGGTNTFSGTNSFSNPVIGVDGTLATHFVTKSQLDAVSGGGGTYTASVPLSIDGGNNITLDDSNYVQYYNTNAINSISFINRKGTSSPYFYFGNADGVSSYVGLHPQNDLGSALGKAASRWSTIYADTGNFTGTVSGVDGTASNHFVTKSQLDAVSGGGINNIVEDLTPQLGGDLDWNGNKSNDITLSLTGGHSKLLEEGGAELIDFVDANSTVLINDGGLEVSGGTTRMPSSTIANINSSDNKVLITKEYFNASGNIPEAPIDGDGYLRSSAGWTGLSSVVRNNLISTDTALPLSANQGKVLNENKVDKLSSITDTNLHVVFSVGHKEEYIRNISTTPVNYTVPDNATDPLGIGYRVYLRQASTGQITIVPENGNVTINTSETLKSRKQGSSLALIKVALNEWDLLGDTEKL